MIESLSDILKLKPQKFKLYKGALDEKPKAPFNGLLFGKELYEKLWNIIIKFL
jgi:hypothetical protein